MAVRAADIITLAVIPSPSYVRQYYLLQASGLSVPNVPTTNPPTGGWSVTEPSYTAGSTNTLYTVMLTAYGSVAFEYGPVQVSSSYEAAKQAYNLASGAVGAANTALEAANGKNKIIFSTAVASGTAYTEGDVWFRKSGSTIIAQYEFVSGAWAIRTLTNAVISTLDAGKITTGTLAAARIAAQTLSANKLVVGDFEDLVDSGNMDTLINWTLSGTPTLVNDVDASDGKAISFLTNAGVVQERPIPVKPGDQLLIELRYKTKNYTGAPVGGVRLHSQASAEAASYDGNYNLVASTAFTTLKLVATILDGVTAVRPRLAFALTGTMEAVIDTYSIRRINKGELIVDGGITAEKIAVSSILANHIGAGAVTAEKIAASAILAENISAGAVTAGKIAAASITASELAASSITADKVAAGAITATALSADVGGQLDISANNSVNILVGQIAGVQNELNGTSDNLEEMQTYYSFGAQGAVVSTPGSPFSLALRSDRIEMLENGNVVSYWNSGQMHVTSFEGEEVILGNHKLEKYNTGTVVRSL